MTKWGIYSVEKICEKFLMLLKNLYTVLMTLMVDARHIIWRASNIRKILKILFLKIIILCDILNALEWLKIRV